MQINSTDTISDNLVSTIPANYCFDIDGDGSIAPINLYGELITYTNQNNFSVQVGSFKGTANINGVDCRISAVLQKDLYNTVLGAGITIIPEYAQCLEDYIFFALGESVITEELLQNWELNTSAMMPEFEENFSKDTITRTTDAEYIDTITSSFTNYPNIDDPAHETEVYYSETNERVYFGVRSYAENVEEYFDTLGGLATANISHLSTLLSLSGDDRDGPAKVDGVHYFGTNTTSFESAFDTDTISTMLSIASDVFNLPSIAVTILDTILNGLAGSRGSVNVGDMQMGIDVTLDFQDFLGVSLNPVDFDDTLFPIAYNLDSTRAGVYDFYATTDLEYRVSFIPSAGVGDIIFFDVETSTARSEDFSLYISN